MKVLAVDPGTKRVGIAVSDPSGTLARPLVTLDGRDRYRLIRRLCELVEAHRIEEVVVGYPLHLDGTRGSAARAAEWLRDRLARQVAVPVKLVDERLSTVAAQELLARRPSPRADVDSLAAAILLQGYLDEPGPTEERGAPDANREPQ